MAHPAFRLGKFKVLDRYEVRFGRDGEGFFFYEMEDLESLALVDVKDGLSETEFLEALGCALGEAQLLDIQQLVHSLL